MAWPIGDRGSLEQAISTAFRMSLATWYPGRHAASIRRLAADATGQEGLRIEPLGGSPFELRLDPSTHLPIRIVEIHEEGTRTIELQKYHSYGGRLVATDLRLVDSGGARPSPCTCRASCSTAARRQVDMRHPPHRPTPTCDTASHRRRSASRFGMDMSMSRST